MSDENAERRQQPRAPHNMQGLLRFAVENTRSEDAPRPSNYEEMDPERRVFLEEALKAMTVNVVEQLEMAAQVLTNDFASESEKLDSLEIITDYVDNIDTANDFCKIGGLSIILPCLNSPYTTIRAQTASLIAELSQNNPFCQKELLEKNAIPKLIELLSDPSTAKNALHSISCVVRNFEPCLAAFIDIGGLECILGCLQSTDDKVIIRALFLMNALCSEFAGVRDELVKLKAVEQVVQLLRPSPEFSVQTDTTLAVINILTENNEAASRCQESDLNLYSTLQDILKLSEGKPECQETIEYCQSLSFKLFNLSAENATDR